MRCGDAERLTTRASQTARELVQEARARSEVVALRQEFEETSTGMAVALDVREPFEWEKHIKGAVQVPRGVLEFAAAHTSSDHNSALEPSRRVIVYCRSGTRTALAALTHQTLGFEHIANLEGGFNVRKAAGVADQ